MSTVWSVVGAVIAVIIAFWLVNFLLSAVWMLVRLALVAVVALAVYAVIKSLVSKRE